MRRWAVRILIVLAAVYVGIVGVAWFAQRSLQYFPDPHEAAPDVPGVEVVRLTTADGEKLVAWHLPPKGDRPVLLHFNGNGGGLSLQRDRWRRIADAGVGFFAVAYRGYAGSTGRPTEKGLHEDARAAYAWVAGRYPASRIVIHGYSLGSGVAVPLAAEKPARALVLEAPFTSAVDVAKLRMGWLPIDLMMQDRYLSAERIGAVRMPVLVVHGDRDSVIPFEMGERLYARARQPKRFVAVKGSDHNTLVRDGLYDHVWRFLGLDPAAAAADDQPSGGG